MTQVTPASIAYVATQVWTTVANQLKLIIVSQTRFALSSSAVFSRTDTVTDSERFYNSILEYFEDIDEQDEVRELLIWWNRSVFMISYSVYSRFAYMVPYAGKSFLLIPRRIAFLLRTARVRS